MSEPTSPDKTPFKPLGRHLKYLREQLQESVLEASGAVEIDPDTLKRIEDGLERPSEDILMLLIQHYNPQDQEAVQLWELAGYEGDRDPKQRLEDIMGHLGSNKQLIMLMAMDVRTMYSDGLDIDITKAGLTMNFTQATSQNRRTAVGRIGMSYDQAAEVLKTLQTALLRANYLKHPRGLPEPKDDTSTTQ
jgi:hypothetical protein